MRPYQKMASALPLEMDEFDSHPSHGHHSSHHGHGSEMGSMMEESQGTLVGAASRSRSKAALHEELSGVSSKRS